MIAGAWITVVPDLLNGTTNSTEEFRENIWIRFGLQPKGLRQTCNGCGRKLTVDHALQCKKGSIITIFHNDVSDGWGALCDSALTPSIVYHEPLINYGGKRTVMGATVA